MSHVTTRCAEARWLTLTEATEVLESKLTRLSGETLHKTTALEFDDLSAAHHTGKLWLVTVGYGIH